MNENSSFKVPKSRFNEGSIFRLLCSFPIILICLYIISIILDGFDFGFIYHFLKCAVIILILYFLYHYFGRTYIEITNQRIIGRALPSNEFEIPFKDIKGIKLCGLRGVLISTVSKKYRVIFLADNKSLVEMIMKEVNLMDGAKFSVYGVNGQLFVYDNKVVIERQGVLGFLSQGSAGSKTIPISNIMSVQFQEGNGLTNGFIQFGIMGGKEAKGGLFAATEDENSVMIKESDNDLVRDIKDYIENIIINRNNNSGTTVIQQHISEADELMKFKTLLDSGVISQEEFDLKKKQLLGL